MLTLRVFLVYALIAQLGAAYRCCPGHVQCEVPDSAACCSTASCCSPISVTKSCCPTHDSDDRETDPAGSCPCCKEHRLSSKQPMEGVPAPEITSLSVLAAPALAPSFQQPGSDAFVVYWEARPLRARPTIERLAQLSVWRT